MTRTPARWKRECDTDASCSNFHHVTPRPGTVISSRSSSNSTRIFNGCGSRYRRWRICRRGDRRRGMKILRSHRAHPVDRVVHRPVIRAGPSPAEVVLGVDRQAACRLVDQLDHVVARLAVGSGCRTSPVAGLQKVNFQNVSPAAIAVALTRMGKLDHSWAKS